MKGFFSENKLKIAAVAALMGSVSIGLYLWHKSKSKSSAVATEGKKEEKKDSISGLDPEVYPNPFFDSTMYYPI